MFETILEVAGPTCTLIICLFMVPFVTAIVVSFSLLGAVILTNALMFKAAKACLFYFTEWVNAGRSPPEDVTERMRELEEEAERTKKERKLREAGKIGPLRIPDYPDEYPPVRDKMILAFCATHGMTPPVRNPNDFSGGYSDEWRERFPVIRSESLAEARETATMKEVVAHPEIAESVFDDLPKAPSMLVQEPRSFNDDPIKNLEDSGMLPFHNDSVEEDARAFGMVPSLGIRRDFETIGGYHLRPFSQEDLEQLDALNGQISLYPEYHNYKPAKLMSRSAPNGACSDIPSTPASVSSTSQDGPFSGDDELRHSHGRQDSLAILVRTVQETAASMPSSNSNPDSAPVSMASGCQHSPYSLGTRRID